MSPASKSQSKDNSTPKAGKEQSKTLLKPSTVLPNSNHGSPARTHTPGIGTSNHGSPARTHTPGMGTSHVLFDTSPAFSPPRSNGQFRPDPDEHSVSSQGTTEYDSSSNNSCSDESEDQKEKPTTSPPQLENILCCDNDKRDKKNRQKNERKHQRQKEKRAQDLQERCTAFLTSRKLEALSHQLEAMGFPVDRATMAVIMNKGRVEECVAWLLHERDDNDERVSINLEDKSCVALDIADELARIAKMAVKHKCSRQDVERAVVACEGDLLKADENLKVQRRDVASAKSGESVDSMKLNDMVASPNNSMASMKNPMEGAMTIANATQLQQGRYSNLSKYSPKLIDWLRNQSALLLPSSPVQPSALPTKREAQAPTEPFIVMQRPKDILAVDDVSKKHTVMSTNGSAPQRYYPQNNLSPVQLPPAAWSVSGTTWPSPGLFSGTMWSSPGLFSGWGSSSPSKSSPSQNDGWNARGSTPNRDYTSIDWSLDLTPLRPSMKIDCVPNTWSTMFMGGNAARPPPSSSPLINGGGGIYLPVLQEAGGLSSDPSGYGGSSPEWSGPFGGRDLFRVPRQYVTSPSM